MNRDRSHCARMQGCPDELAEISLRVRPTRGKGAEKETAEAENEAEAKADLIISAMQKKGIPEDRFVIAIDGRCGSGKTTLTEILCRRLGADAVHMDYFYLTPEQRTEARFSEPGGNVNYERFSEEVLPHLGKPEGFSYRRYDFPTRSFSGICSVRSGQRVIVEGAYSLHPFFGDYADLRVFSDIGREEQERRILLRNGPEGLKNFRKIWIPLEENYLSACRIREICDIMV